MESRQIHRYPLTVQFDEVDQYGIVHHPRYFIYMERARVELMGMLGMRPDGPEDRKLGLVVVSAEAKFRASARFLDQLVVEQGCRAVGASRVELLYRIARGATTIAEALLTLAFVDQTGRPVRAPDGLRDGLRGMAVPETAFGRA